jgi:hypothetical protein
MGKQNTATVSDDGVRGDADVHADTLCLPAWPRVPRRRLARVSDSAVDLLERSLEEEGGAAPETRPTASLLGFVGVSAGFAVLIALCAVAAITLWFALFGHDLLRPLSLIVAWLAQGGVVAVGG